MPSKPALHSRYNPVGEAEKYIASLTFREAPQFIILLEPGQGYMIPILGRKFPEAKIIALYVEKAVSPEPADAVVSPVCWEPGCGVSLERFLEQEIPDIEASAVRIIEWRPALAAYGEAYRRLVVETTAVIKRLDANKRTTRAFGRRWVANFFRNLRILRRVIRQGGSSAGFPCIVAGAGPSLEETLPVIKGLKARGSLLVLGVSAAVPAFRARGFAPDLVVATDGGGWALWHLYESFRAGGCPFGFGASLSAALPSQSADMPALLMSDGSLWQNRILTALALPFVNLPQRGTVTASALDLAFAVTAGAVCVTGLDLGHRDICAHARPYALDRSLEAASSRLNPLYAQAFARSAGILKGGSLRVYADWFGSQLSAYPKRLYSMGKNHRVFDALPSWETADWDFSPGGPGFTAQTLPADSNRARQGRDILLSILGSTITVPVGPQSNLSNTVTVPAGPQSNLSNTFSVPAGPQSDINTTQTAEIIRRELSSLLFPDAKSTVSTETLCDAIRRITAPYTGEKIV